MLTLPSEVTRMASAPLVFMTSGWASLVPRKLVVVVPKVLPLSSQGMVSCSFLIELFSVFALVANARRIAHNEASEAPADESGMNWRRNLAITGLFTGVRRR